MKKLSLIVLIILSFFSACGTRPEKVELDTNLYWNQANPLSITINQSVSKSFVSIILQDNDNKIPLDTASILITRTNTQLMIQPFKLGLLEEKLYNLEIYIDDSLVYDNPLVVDRTIPVIKIIRQSPSIVRGGSAAVKFEAGDQHLKSVILSEKETGLFYPQKYQRDNCFLSLIAWPVYQMMFEPKIIVMDKAGNAATNSLRMDTVEKKYPLSRIGIDQQFVSKEKLAEVGELNVSGNNFEKYELLQMGFQKKKEIEISDLVSKIDMGKADNFIFQSYSPIQGYKITSDFGEHRLFVMNKKVMRESYHLGLDMAKKVKTEIIAISGGGVVYQGYNGANGNIVLIEHGLGIYSLYAHCSEIFVKKGDQVSGGQRIAKSGDTGYALGDHLHLSIFVQGRPVNPEEWIDKNWVRRNILDVLSR